jgi:hypothetical protein
MAANLAAHLANVRKALHDEDAAAYVWTDAVLTRHIDHAVNELSIELPREMKTTLTATAGSRDLSTSTLTDRVDIERVEWPVGEFPPRLVGFSAWASVLTLDVVAAPNSAQSVYVYWTAKHLVDASGSTIPTVFDDLLAAGACAFAALDREVFAVNKLNVGGDAVAGRYQAFGEERLAYFRRELARLGRRNTVRGRRMYSTDAPSIFEQGRVKY